LALKRREQRHRARAIQEVADPEAAVKFRLARREQKRRRDRTQAAERRLRAKVFDSRVRQK